MDHQLPISILVADGEELFRRALTFIVKGHPRFLLSGEAPDGESAVGKVLEVKPDVVLMNIRLPGLGGSETIRMIKQACSTIRVLLTANVLVDTEIVEALKAGADGFCLQSTGQDTLIRAIEAIAEGAAWLDRAVVDRVLGWSSQCLPALPGQNGELSVREHDVLSLVVEGMSNMQIASRLHLSSETVKTHIRHILEKLSVAGRTQAAVKAMKYRMVS